MRHSKGSGGFTVLELIVVILVIGILSSLIVVGITSAIISSKVSATRTLLTTLKAACESYSRVWGDYPPSYLEIENLNQKNNGIESFVFCLASKKRGGPYLKDIETGRFINLDGDSLPESVAKKVDWMFGDRQLREISDYFGNPVVYFHHRDYKNPPKKIRKYSSKEPQDCYPVKDPNIRDFRNPRGFQFISLGPNGRFDKGKVDDIVE
jgi:prepilin-type N-terminal cleavage/methylation domain-containing protein